MLCTLAVESFLLFKLPDPSFEKLQEGFLDCDSEKGLHLYSLMKVTC